jgi:FMN phosphatase YigB (HAD superfamily)
VLLYIGNWPSGKAMGSGPMIRGFESLIPSQFSIINLFNMPLKTIFIDWDGTLSVSRFWGHWQTEDISAYNLIQRSLFRDNPGIIHDWMRGFVSAEQVCAEVSIRTNIDRHKLILNLEKSCREMKFIYPDSLDIIQEKRKSGIKVLIATDNMDTFNRWTMPSLKLDEYFDGVINSFTRGALKNEVDNAGRSLFFQHYLSQNSLFPEETLWIDDQPAQDTAKLLGMKFSQVSSAFTVIQALELT